MRLNFSLFSLASYRINNFKSRTYIVFAFLAVLFFFGFSLFIKHLHKARTNEVVKGGSSIMPTFAYNSCLWSWSDFVNAPALLSIFIVWMLIRTWSEVHHQFGEVVDKAKKTWLIAIKLERVWVGSYQRVTYGTLCMQISVQANTHVCVCGMCVC